MIFLCFEHTVAAAAQIKLHFDASEHLREEQVRVAAVAFVDFVLDTTARYSLETNVVRLFVCLVTNLANV